MANFVTRNILICVVPAVVLLLSVYWFRKKKKIKPDISTSNSKNTLSVYKGNDAYNTSCSLCSSTSDFSNSFSDTSSMSSPENSQKTLKTLNSMPGDILNELQNDCTESVTVSNHIEQLNYNISFTKEEIVNSQIQHEDKLEKLNTSVGSLGCEEKALNEHSVTLKENIVNSLCNINSSLSDARQKSSAENIIEAFDTADFYSGFHDINNFQVEEQQKKCIVSDVMTSEIPKEPIVSQELNTSISEPNQLAKVKSDDSAIHLENDSYSSILDENSSIADESEIQTDLKYKSSPSSVFDGNSLSDESERTDSSNEQNTEIKHDEICKDNICFDACDFELGSSNETDEKYSLKQNKNSFLKTVLVTDTSNEVSSSNFTGTVFSPTSSLCNNYELPDSFNKEVINSEQTEYHTQFVRSVIKNNSDTADQHDDQPTQLNKHVDSHKDNDCAQYLCKLQNMDIASLKSETVLLDFVDQYNNQSIQLNNDVHSKDNDCIPQSLSSCPQWILQKSEIEAMNNVPSTSETVLLDSENVISSTTSNENCNLIEEQPELFVDSQTSDIISFTNEVIGDTEKANSSVLLDSSSGADTDTSSVLVKKANNELEAFPVLTNPSTLDNHKTISSCPPCSEDPSPSNKVLDEKPCNLDIKSSGVNPGQFIYEFDLPQELCGRLIGRQGKHVKSIKERTNANVFIKRHPFDSNLKTVVIEGIRSSVYEALEIIRRKFPSSQYPAVTLLQTNMVSAHGVPLPDSLQLHLPEGASCDVILSSLVSAGHFFLQQPTHPTYPSLSTLDQCMNTCYTQIDTPLLPQPVEPGVICAAPVMNGWFRAQIIYVYENRTECEIKFVDYGGFSQFAVSGLRQIRSDFMTLPFQASECYLANVRPVDRNTGWSADATAMFEELAQGQILQALLVEYADDGIPCVHLYRVQGVSSMFINRELVERGLAVWVDSCHWDPH